MPSTGARWLKLLLGNHALILALLFLPVFYYSLTTPFALVDDYGDWYYFLFDSPKQFFRWFESRFLDLGHFGHNRYRPFWEFYNAVTWKVFGPTPHLHHLARWVVHFGAVFAFAAAFLCFARYRQTEHGAASRLFRHLPLALLVYIWLFFPNSPASRLAPQEVYTVFFLGLCNWMLALMLLQEGRKGKIRATRLIYGLFYLGCLGLAWSKEINIAVLLWLLVCYYALLLIGVRRRTNLAQQGLGGSAMDAIRSLKGVSRWKVLGGLSLVLVFLHTLDRVYDIKEAGGYGTSAVTPGLIRENASWILRGLFQVDTSLLITAGFALLSALLLLSVIVKAIKRRFSDEFIFVLFLLGQFASMFLILSASWGVVLRYWYILVPVFTTLLAFSAKFALEFAAARRPLRWSFVRFAHPRLLAASALTGFIIFFICCNYYNFLFQTVVQHSTRHTEAKLLAEITRLHEQGQYVQVLYENPNELLHKIVNSYPNFLLWFYGKKIDVHTAPPDDTGQPYYIVKHTEAQPHNLPENYRLLSYAYNVASVLQGGRPYEWRDAEVPIWSWYIYDNELNRVWRNGLVVHRLIEEAGEPIIRSVFDVYRNGDELIYKKEPCGPNDVDKKFFLHIVPVDNSDLPEWRKQHSFDNLDFDFEAYGLSGGGRCLAVFQLPAYGIASIRTGQYVPGEGRVWEAEVSLDE